MALYSSWIISFLTSELGYLFVGVFSASPIVMLVTVTCCTLKKKKKKKNRNREEKFSIQCDVQFDYNLLFTKMAKISRSVSNYR